MYKEQIMNQERQTQFHVPPYSKDGFAMAVILAIVIAIWSHYSFSFHYSELYQHLSVLATVSFAFAILLPILDLFTGLFILRYEESRHRSGIFILNVILILAIYFIGVKFFAFNHRVHFF